MDTVIITNVGSYTQRAILQLQPKKPLIVHIYLSSRLSTRLFLYNPPDGNGNYVPSTVHTLKIFFLCMNAKLIYSICNLKYSNIKYLAKGFEEILTLSWCF
jgi:hypothetical protein